MRAGIFVRTVTTYWYHKAPFIDTEVDLDTCMHGRSFLPVRFFDQLLCNFLGFAPGLAVVVAGNKEPRTIQSSGLLQMAIEPAFVDGLAVSVSKRRTGNKGKKSGSSGDQLQSPWASYENFPCLENS